MTTDHTCNGCAKCVPELSADYWRKRAHKAELELAAMQELTEAYKEQTQLLTSRISELNKETERLNNELTRFWS